MWVLLSLFSMTCLGNTKESRSIEVSPSHKYDKWLKVVVSLREYKNIISTMSLEIEYTMSLSSTNGMK